MKFSIFFFVLKKIYLFCSRLLPLLQSGKLIYGGKVDRDDLYIEPTILDDVKLTDPIMQDEVI